MEIVGPKSQLKHYKRVEGTETSAGVPVTWATPIRFEGVMFLLTGNEIAEYQKHDVNVRYKILTNYLTIDEKDRIKQGDIYYDVELIDDVFLMDKILVVLLSAKKEWN